MVHAEPPHQQPERKEPASRIGAFLRKHNWILTFFGATVVLVTFIVREGIREHLKSLTESIDTAETVFLIRTELRELRDRIGTSQTAKSDTEDTPFRIAARDIDDSHRYLHRAGDELGIITGLVNKLPDQRVMIQSVNDGRTWDSFLTLRDGSQPVRITITNTWFVGTKTPGMHWYALENQRKQLWKDESAVRGMMRPDHRGEKEAALAASKLESASFYLFLDTHDFGSLVLKEARKAKEEKEHGYEVFTKISYGLYGLGWTLGLLGRILRIPGLSAEE